MSTWDYVQLYRKLGWVCIPTFNGQKRPKISSWKEFQKRKPTQQEYESWFMDINDVGVAIVTGEISNLTVIDNDIYKEGSLKLDIDTPLIADSGSGGKHFYFRHNYKIPTFKNEKIGVDVRSEGGLIFAPPMIHPNGKKYVWFTELITDINQLPICPDEVIEYAPLKPTSGFDWTSASDIEMGARDDTIYRAADSLIAKGFDYDTALSLLRGVNNTYKPPLADSIIIEKLKNAISFINPQKKEGNYNKEKVSWPSPINEAAYYGLTGEMIKIFEPHTEADPVAILINFLTTAGSVIGDTPFFKVEASKHRMRIFGVLVGDTSKGRKGTSWDYIKFIFESIDDNWKRNIQTGLSSGEGLIWAVRDEIIKKQPLKDKSKKVVGYQDVVEDEGIEDKRLLIIEPEFSSTLRVIGREGNTLSAIIRNAWDTGDLQTLTKNSSAKATGAHISIIGHITTEELLRYLTNTEVANGFGNRFLWLCVKRSKELPHGGNFQSVDFSALVNRLRETIEYARNIEQIKWDERTYFLWTKIYHHLSQGRPGLVGSLTARSEAYVCRIASIYALLDKSELIRIEHLKAAVAIFDYVEESAKYIFRDKTGDPLANKILEAITTNPNGMTKTDINNYFGRNVDAEQISTSLEFLLKIGKIKNKLIQTSGRPRELFSLNSFNSYANPGRSYLEKLEEYILDEGYETNEKNEISNKETDDEQFPY